MVINSLRDFIEACDKMGQVKRITAEVDWNLEISHIAKLNEIKQGPALLFENVKGYDIPVLTSALTTPERLAVTLGMPADYSMCRMAEEWMKIATKELIKPVEVKTGPVMEKVIEGKDINLFDFPALYNYPLDGGRYIGTACFLISQDPETGWTNLGTYRMQVLDEKSVGVNAQKGKHAEMHIRKYEKMGKKMPVAAVFGSDPLQFLVSSTMVAAQADEYDLVGALRGEPVEVIKSDLTGLQIPAHAEIIVEGEIDPTDLRDEGPFGEYTGYYSSKTGKDKPQPWINIKRILCREKPIYWTTTVGYPVTDTHMIQCLNRSAVLWTELETMAVPGIKSVFIPPEACGRFWAIISVKTMYPGHANHVASAAISTTNGHYGLKGVIVVDDDIPADDIGRVLWSLAVRYNPAQDSQIIEKGRSTPLDPSLPTDQREIGSRILMDATIPYQWKEKPTLIALDEETEKRVQSRWEEYGFGKA